MNLVRLPNILIIHLKRFKKKYGQHSHYIRKNNSIINFPIKKLNLSQYCINKKSKSTYNLFAVSNHFGGVDGGHYTAMCRNYLKKKWYCFDDDNVSKISKPNEVISRAAYVLFYERVN